VILHLENGARFPNLLRAESIGYPIFGVSDLMPNTVSPPPFRIQHRPNVQLAPTTDPDTGRLGSSIVYGGTEHLAIVDARRSLATVNARRR